MVARRILRGPWACCDLSVEVLEEMVDLGHDGAPSDGLSEASRELLARARGGNEDALKAVLRLAKSGRGSALVARRMLLGDGKANSGRSSAVAACKALENEVDGGLDGGPNGSAGLGDASSELPACRHGVYPCCDECYGEDKARLA